MSEESQKAQRASGEATNALNRARSHLDSSVINAENEKYGEALESASWALRNLGAAVMHLGDAICHQTKWECAPHGD